MYVIVLPLARLAIGAAALCGVAAAGFGGYWMAVGPDGVARLFEGTPIVEPAQATLDMPELLVNLRPDTPSRFMKIGVTLALAPKDRGRVEQAMPHLVNAQQEFLRNIDQHDLRGSAGLLRLRGELRRRFNLILGPDTVSDVLLRSLLTQ
ncbi:MULTISPECIES: flagellar basal body-associated FliL family protein [Azospirillum]|nr:MULTISPECIES: flagellar basal body-associated FliL family protein [Azospirillum]